MSLPIDPHIPWVWLLGSLALAIVATNLAGWLFSLARRGRADAAGWSWLPPIGWLLASLFFLLPPLGAWRFGVLSPYLMGLTEIDWIESLPGSGLAALVVALLIFGWLVYRRSLPPGAPPGRIERAGRIVRAPLDAGLQQWHWAFYRALAIDLFPAAAAGLADLPFASSLARQLEAQPLYWGSWLGLALIAAEWALNPFSRAGLRRPGRREAGLRRVILAIATTALFALTRDFWLCLACDIIIETAIAAWFPLPE